VRLEESGRRKRWGWEPVEVRVRISSGELGCLCWADLMGFFSPLGPLVLSFSFSFTGDYLNLLG